MLSYAGVRLLDCLDDLDTSVTADLDPAYSLNCLRRVYPGDKMSEIAWVGHEPSPPAQLNVLRWPAWGASRWAEGLFLCTHSDLREIRRACYPGGVLTAKDWVMDDGRKSVTCPLFMLPPRPLYDAGGGAESLWLLTLVDERFFWWYRTGSVSVDPGTTTWAQLFTQLATALDITLTVPDIAAGYLKPGPGFFWDRRPLPLLLDAACLSTGLRMARYLSGANECVTPAASLRQHKLNLATADRLAGGHLDLRTDQPANVPEAYTLAFPRADGSAAYAKRVTLESLNLAAPLAPGRYFDDTKLARTTAVAQQTATPTNAAELDALAELLAADWYSWRIGQSEARYEGAVAWVMEGLTGSVEYEHRSGRLSTRVCRPPELEHADEHLHLSTAYPYGYTAWPSWSYQYHAGTNYYAGGTVTYQGTDFNFNGGTFDWVGTAVTIDATSSLSIAAPVTVTETTLVTVESGDTLTFTGPGTVEFDEDSILVVGGDTTFPSTSTTTFSDGSTVTLESTTWTINTNDTWTVDGDSTTLFVVNSPTELNDSVFITGSLNYDVTTYSAITTNQTALTFPATAYIRLPVNSAVELQGIVAPSPESTTFFIVTNVGTDTFTIKNSSGSAGSAFYQVATPDGQDYELTAGESVPFIYDIVTDQYRIIGPPKSSSATLTYGSAALGSQYNLTGTMAATGLSVTLPSAGTYLITCHVLTYIEGNQHEFNRFELYNSTDAASLDGEAHLELAANTSAQALGGSLTLSPAPLTVAASKTIQLRGRSTTSTSATVEATDTILRYVKIA